MAASSAYYIRKPGGATQGPFPAEKIRGYIEQGRVRKEMEFSTDGRTWLPGAEVHDLFPPAPARAPSPRGPRAPARRKAREPKQRTPASRAPSDPDERYEVNRAIATAHRNLLAMRSLFVADAILVGLAFLLALTTDSSVFKLVVGGLLLVIVLCVVYVKRFPLACALVLALFHLAVAAPFLLSGLKGISGRIYVLLAFATWGAVAMAANLQKLLKRYPDALAAKRFRGEHIAADAGTKWQDRMREDRAAGRKKLALYVGLPLLLGILALFVVAGMGAPSDKDEGRSAYAPPTPEAPLQPRLDAFRLAWNAQSLDDITAFFASDVRPHKTRLLTKLFRRRKWNEERPNITYQKRDSVVAYQVAVFWTITDDDKVMQTDWQWENGGWWLLDLKLRIPK